MSSAEWLTKNRAMWDEKAPVHLTSPMYDVPGFKAGRLSLQAHEIEDLRDVAGRDLIHLQCHIGLDTLSWARLGANVTGVDFSAASIRGAEALAEELGLKAQFHVCDVYDTPSVVGHRFDVVYTGVGALCWLPDIARWARVARDLLKPGGELYLFEFHPVEWMLDLAADGRLALNFDYFTPPEGYRDAGAVDYAGANEMQASETVQWNHPLGAVVTALVDAGLRIDSLRELPASVLQKWDCMERTETGMFQMAKGLPSTPLMYVLRASLRS
jgi:SAM-dependent methyltransferase